MQKILLSLFVIQALSAVQFQVRTQNNNQSQQLQAQIASLEAQLADATNRLNQSQAAQSSLQEQLMNAQRQVASLNEVLSMNMQELNTLQTQRDEALQQAQ